MKTKIWCRECVKAGARTCRSLGHHLMHPLILRPKLSRMHLYPQIHISNAFPVVSLILPKNERWENFQYMKLSQRSFLGRIQDALICFRDLLTFSRHINPIVHPFLYTCVIKQIQWTQCHVTKKAVQNLF